MGKQLLTFSSVLILFVCYAQNKSAKAQSDVSSFSDTTKIKQYFHLAEKLSNSPDSALIYYQKALNMAKHINSQKFIALSLKYIGTYHYYRADYKNALDHWENSLQVYISMNNKKGIGSLSGNIGLIYEHKGDFQTALEKFKEALLIFEELNDKEGIARNYGNIGILYDYQGDYTKSLQYHQQALKINEEIGNERNIASNLVNIGIVLKNQDDFDKASEFYQKALKIYIKLEDNIKIARTYTNIGIVYASQKNYPEALKQYSEALKINKEIGNETIIASNLENIGIIHEYQGDYSLALGYYQEALKINEENSNKKSLATNLTNLASVYNKLKEYRKSINYANKALATTKETGDLNLERHIYNHLSESYQNIGNYKEALNCAIQWIKLNDSIYGTEKAKAIADIHTRYETEKKDQAIESLQKDNRIKILELAESNQRAKVQRILFIAAALVLLSASFVIWFVFRNFKKQQVIKQQNLLFQKLITEQKMLRSQMNPHFIYNSLNSIQSFISSEQSYEAEKYLANFARLIRGILENSRENLISLEKEIEILELYLNLEKLRFEKRFSYQINTDNEIEAEFISVPPMIIQPFVENSIIHGFKNMENGELIINFTEEENYLICEIDDNGIGRKASAVYAKNKTHKSLATTITDDRLKIMSNEFGKQASIQIEDKIDKITLNSLGTRVIIKLPIIE